ncbi:MAG: hypothetical protein CMI02_07720 [Oceanospirillaceae bacterium]|nr:hypothetical protein [Oceanospirillaceae bacterium]MBT11906.1 hypothetical protein [Oceanospirillaceae bacterium]|tara:strand:+ start:17382 stop:18212 length:831 start_codon:yes stop_codon:yes gene_type:complete
MKVFISWSGSHSRKLGEAIRDWLPGVIQLVTPYFTPSDIEKGTRWSNDISKELTESQIGILCVTQENIHSDWILFEAGALSKSLDKSHVCPILFGITNTDLAGPLKQFQTTEFEKGDMHRLLGVINSRLGDSKLPQKTLDIVFEKWWPDLEQKITGIIDEIDLPEGPVRPDRELLEEILQLSRHTSKVSSRPSIAPAAIQDLLEHYIALHDEQATEQGSFQETLDSLQKMHKAVNHIASRYKGNSEELDELMSKFRNLPYVVEDTSSADDDDDMPF